jgi:hypothetical protein
VFRSSILYWCPTESGGLCSQIKAIEKDDLIPRLRAGGRERGGASHARRESEREREICIERARETYTYREREIERAREREIQRDRGRGETARQRERSDLGDAGDAERPEGRGHQHDAQPANGAIRPVLRLVRLLLSLPAMSRAFLAHVNEHLKPTSASTLQSPHQ